MGLGVTIPRPRPYLSIATPLLKDTKMLFASPVTATHELKYGTQHVHSNVKFEDGQFTNYRQESSYVSKVTGAVEWTELFSAGPNDLSAQHTRSETYDTRCACCYLNIGHTQDRHQQELDKFGA